MSILKILKLYETRLYRKTLSGMWSEIRDRKQNATFLLRKMQCCIWKSPVCVTPEAQVPLTLESKFRMTPIKS